MTLSVAGQCSEVTARQLTDQLRQSLSLSWELLVEAYQRRAWAALGYESWDAYTDGELGETRLRLPREQRREVVQSMTEAGMSVRAISSAVGIGVGTVHRDQAPVPSGTPDEVVDAELVDELNESPLKTAANQMRQELNLPEPPPLAERIAAAVTRHSRPVQGVDGKSYPAKPATRRRRPLPDAFWDVAFELRKVTDKATRLANDDRFSTHAEFIASVHRTEIARARDALQALLEQLPDPATPHAQETP